MSEKKLSEQFLTRALQHHQLTTRDAQAVLDLEQTIDNLCAANEQANTLLGAEIERRELAEARLAALEACGLLVYMKADKVWQSDNCVAATLTEIADGEIKASKIVDAICADIRDAGETGTMECVIGGCDRPDCMVCRHYVDADGATPRNDAADATQSDLAKSTGIVDDGQGGAK